MSFFINGSLDYFVFLVKSSETIIASIAIFFCLKIASISKAFNGVNFFVVPGIDLLLASESFYVVWKKDIKVLFLIILCIGTDSSILMALTDK